MKITYDLVCTFISSDLNNNNNSCTSMETSHTFIKQATLPCPLLERGGMGCKGGKDGIHVENWEW
jgi:hypothetical protein